MTDLTVRKQRGRPFVKGQSGNPAGRPIGARNKVSALFMENVYDQWQKYGIEALKKAAQEEPMQFCKMMAGLVPKETNNTTDIQVSFLDALKRISSDEPAIDVEFEDGE